MIQCFQIGLTPHFTFTIGLNGMEKQKTMIDGIISWYDDVGFIIIPITIITSWLIYIESNAFSAAIIGLVLCGIGLLLNYLSGISGAQKQ